MAWADSRIFQATINDSLAKIAAFDLDTDQITVALFGTSVTPDRTVASAATAYAAGVWAAGGVSDATGWPAAGRDLGSKTMTPSAGTVTFDAADLASANSNTTLAAVFGCLVYENTLTTPVADQGVCYNYFGGTQSVTAGTFTIVWNASGIATITV